MDGLPGNESGYGYQWVQCGQRSGDGDLRGDVEDVRGGDGGRGEEAQGEGELHGRRGYASFTFKVSDGTEESAATYTMTVDVTGGERRSDGGSDDQRRGARGADAEGVADGGSRTWTGLPGNESGYGYQWVRVDSGVETDISRGDVEDVRRW